MSEYNVNSLEKEIAAMPDPSKGIENGEIPSVKPDLETASEVFKLVEGLGGDVDKNMADLVEHTNEFAKSHPGDKSWNEAKIADIAGAYKVLQGGDIDDTARTLGEQPEGPLGAALGEINAADPSGEAVQVVTGAIDAVRRQETTLEQRDERIFSTVDFVTESLRKNPENRDKLGLIRPTYEIGSRTVAFRNRMELVDLSGRAVTVVGAGDVKPFSELPQDWEGAREKIEKVNSFSLEHSTDSPENVLIVPNTPLGIVDAAVMLHESDELLGLQQKLREKDYTDPQVLDLVDGILALTSVDDEGRPRDYVDVDGYAVALAALTGDKDAEGCFVSKRESLRAIEADRKSRLADSMRRSAAEMPSVNPLPIEKTFLVHSTSHPIEFDGAEAVFKPAGQHEETEYVPRATWHATINSNVFPHAQAEGAWGRDNHIVIAPLGDAMRATGDKLSSLDGVDTWFTVGPGESVRLPSPTVIEPVGHGDELVQRDGNTIRVLVKDKYTPDQQRQIRNMIERFHAGSYAPTFPSNEDAVTLKEAVVQMVLEERGVGRYERDNPSQSGHGLDNHALASRITAEAARLGVGTGTHFNNMISTAEKDIGWWRVLDATKQTKGGGFQSGVTGPTFCADVPIEARRQALVNGCLQAVAETPRDKEPFDDDFI